VDDRKPRRRESSNDLRDGRSLGFVSVSPKELNQQQELLDYYKHKKQLERINEEQGGSRQQAVITPSGFQRRLQNLPSSMPAKGSHSKEITVSSTGATVGEYVPDEKVQTSALPPASSRSRKYTSSQPSPSNMRWVPTRSTTGPACLQSSSTCGMLNVNMIGDSSTPMPIPRLPHVRSAPVLQIPLTLPLESLPPGYDFAVQAQFRPDANKLRPLRLLSLGECRLRIAHLG
jgi:hypothetical protein